MEKSFGIYNLKIIIRVLGIIFLSISIFLIVSGFIRSYPKNCVFSEGSIIAGVDVSGMEPTGATDVLKFVYDQPLQVKIEENIYYFSNKDLGLSINYSEMVSSLNCNDLSRLQAFWSYIWNRSTDPPVMIDLSYSWDEELFNSALSNFERLVSIEPQASFPIAGTTRFEVGSPGFGIDLNALKGLIKNEMIKHDRDEIKIEMLEFTAKKPEVDQITGQIKQILLGEDFSGVVEIYAERLSDHQKIQILDWYGEEKTPGVAFTAASTMKIPILLSTYWRQELPLSEIMQGWIEYMITYSENDPADRLMEQIDPIRGPLLVTNDIQSLGLDNSFIAGYFYLGAPLLNYYETPANKRVDAFVDPDIYNQTTPEDIGKLLSLIYDCSENQTAELSTLSQGKLTQDECSLIIDALAKNKMGALIEAGLPEDLKIAHKHGWSQEKDGLVHSFSDVAIVYGPEEDFVLTIFTYSPNQLLFDVANPLIARIAQIIYNGFNPNHQIFWPFPE